MLGHRDPNAEEGSVEQLWNINLASLFKQPGIDCKSQSNVGATDIKGNSNNRMYVQVQQYMDRGDNDGEIMQVDPSVNQNSEVPTQSHSFSARPRYHKLDVRRAKLWIANSNNTSADTIANTIDVGAWANTPPGISGGVFRDIAGRKDNIPYLLANSQRTHPGGTGIRSDMPGEVIHIDIQGKWQPDKATGATIVLIIKDEASLYGKVYALKHKSNSRYAVKLWSYGRETIKVRTDLASEVTEDFLRDINSLLDVEDHLEILLPFERYHQPSNKGIRVDKAGPEDYAKTFERSWQMKSWVKRWVITISKRRHVEREIFDVGEKGAELTPDTVGDGEATESWKMGRFERAQVGFRRLLTRNFEESQIR